MSPLPRSIFCDNKIPAPNQCSRLRPNLHLKYSANKNYGFIVISVAPLSLGQLSDMHIIGIYSGSGGTS